MYIIPNQYPVTFRFAYSIFNAHENKSWVSEFQGCKFKDVRYSRQMYFLHFHQTIGTSYLYVPQQNHANLVEREELDFTIMQDK